MEKYTKVKQIGEGSFGKAILVKEKETGCHFVVKEIGISKMKPKERDEARKEVSVLSKMHHPNIVHYMESFEENGHLYIVMEYCEGGDLYALINKQRGILFSEQQVLGWFVQLCLALKHVHDRKILHRDIKTSNIFLTKSGTVKLGDFGIARVLNNTMELARTCIGTPYYLSPEICENKPYNNKSDVWALGCVVYETLTLKHAFEAGNMKNLVLKIIRGSYPPVPSRYSYDLRSLVSQLFRRNPRERPSINSILRKPFLSSLTERYLSPEQHEDEFSHTVLHKGNSKPPSARPSRYQPPAAKRLQNIEVRGSAVAARNRQIAAAYGPSVAARKPKPSASRNRVANAHQAVDDLLQKKRQQLVEQEKKRKEKLLEEKKKRLDDLQKRQQERAQRIKDEQMKRARDQARIMNLKRSADILDKKEDDTSLSKNNNVPARQNVGRDRPISAPRERGDYEKYNQYLGRLEQGDIHGATNFAAPGLDRVKAAWDERNKEQNAIMAAQANRLVGEQAGERAQVVSEYLQRKQEALMNKQKGNFELHGNDRFGKRPKLGVAGALQPYSAASAKGNGGEQQYLARLQQIRQQNYNERRAIQNKKEPGQNAYMVKLSKDDSNMDNEERKKKIKALQQQAEDRAKWLKENMDRKREIMKDKNEKMKFDNKQEKRGQKEMLQVGARQIIPPDERPVKYNSQPLGITEALHAIGAPMIKRQDEDKHEIQQEQPSVGDEMLSPSRPGDANHRKKILKRVNERYSIDFEEGGEKQEDATTLTRAESTKTSPRPLPTLPNKDEQPNKAPVWKQWGNGRDIGLKIADLPLQETASQMEATSMPSSTIADKPAPPKRQWNVPSGTFVNRLNQMAIQTPTMTMQQDTIHPHEIPTLASDDGSNNKDGEESQDNKSSQLPVVKEESTQKSVSSLIKVYSPRALPVPKPSIDTKTVVMKKTPSDIPVAANKPTTEKHLAANFNPVKGCGTYVIKSIEAEIPELPSKLSSEQPETTSSEHSEIVVTVDTDPVVEPTDENESDLKNIAKVDKKGNPVSNEKYTNEVVPIQTETTANFQEKNNLEASKDDTSKEQINEDIEVIEVTDELTTNIGKPMKNDEAWTKEVQQDALPKSTPALPPRPVDLPSPEKTISAATEKNESNEKCAEIEKPTTPPRPLQSISEPVVCQSPLFSKVNKLRLNDETGASVVPENECESVKASPLSRSLYRTANDNVLMKLTLGHFDSPNPKLLRTCSLPDLTSAGEDEKTVSETSLELKMQQEDDSFQEVLVSASMNDTNFDEDEEVDLGSTTDDAAVLTDDEEMEDLRANLENALLNAGDEESASPPFSEKCASSVLLMNEHSDEESDGEINEEWQSDSDSLMDEESSDKAKSDNSDDSDTGSVFCRLERNREQLERDLGLDKFLQVYRRIQAIHEDEDEGVSECESRVRAMLGEKHDLLYRRILQLVMADGAYCEDND